MARSTVESAAPLIPPRVLLRAPNEAARRREREVFVADLKFARYLPGE